MTWSVGTIEFGVTGPVVVDGYGEAMGQSAGSTVFATSSFTLDPADVYLLCVFDDSVGSDPSVPSVSGISLTWTQEATFEMSGDVRITVFSGVGTPSTGAITVTKGEANGATMGLIVVGVNGIDSGSPVVQSAVSSDFASASVSFSLSTFTSASNVGLVLGAVMAQRSAGDFLFTGGYTSIPNTFSSDTGFSGAHDMAVEAAFADAPNDGTGVVNPQITGKFKWAVALELAAT